MCGRKKLPFAGYSVVKDRNFLGFAGALFSRRLTHLTTRDAGHQAGPFTETGGEYRARTGDLLVANQALSQLS